MSNLKTKHLFNYKSIIAPLLQFKELELYWGAVFFLIFKICSHIFRIFEVKSEK